MFDWLNRKPHSTSEASSVSTTGFEFVPSSGIPGPDSYQEVGEIVSKVVRQEAQRRREQIDACFCPVCKSRLWLDLVEDGFVLRLPTTQTDSQPESREKQNAEPIASSQPGRQPLKAGVRYQVHPDGSIRERQTETSISPARVEINTLPHPADCLCCGRGSQPASHLYCAPESSPAD